AHYLYRYDRHGRLTEKTDLIPEGVIRPHAEGAVRVQLRVGQAVTCRVCGIRDINAQVTYNNKSN
ncbi:hypothetical protein DIV12_23020, partial [Escherichia coli]